MKEPQPRQLLVDLRDTVTLGIEDLERIHEEIAGATSVLQKPEPTRLELYGAGALLQSWYTGLERVFEQIARVMDGALAEGPDWHRRLLRSMTLDRPSIRPPVLTRELAEQIDEYLRFRHLFRNMYVFRLKPDRLSELLSGLETIHAEVRRALTEFTGVLDAILGESS